MTEYLADQIQCIKVAVAALQTQVRQLKERDEFIWCKVKDLAGEDLADRVDELEGDLEALSATVDDIQVITDTLDSCGVLTLDCESSDSSSGSFSVSDITGWPNFIISGTEDPDANGEYSFSLELFGSVYYISGGIPLQRLSGTWYIGADLFGWSSDGGEEYPSDVENWTPNGGVTGNPVVTLA